MPKEQLSFFQDIEKEKRKITLSLDKLYIIGVIILVGLVACFGLGVEKGRRLSLAGSKTQPVESVMPHEEASTVPIEKEIIRKVAQQQNAPAIIERAETTQAAGPSLYYSVQVASFKSPTTAKAEAEDLTKRGFAEVDVRPGATWIAICVGRCKTRAEAEKLLTQLRSHYSDCYIRPIKS